MFQLDPEAIVTRIKQSGQPPRIPALGQSLMIGTIGFTLVSLCGFAPWVLAGRWFYRNAGEAGLYAACAIVFIGLSGPLMHRLIIGPGSLVRFYKIFGVAFLAYSVVWIAGWMLLRSAVGADAAGILGLFAGSLAMGAMFAFGFKAFGALLKISVALFAGNVAGYFIGGWVYGALHSKMIWGLFYGLGFGAGLGFAFHVCQAEARRLISAPVPGS